MCIRDRAGGIRSRKPGIWDNPQWPVLPVPIADYHPINPFVALMDCDAYLLTKDEKYYR